MLSIQKIDPQVQGVIRPYIMEMSRIYISEKSFPIIGGSQEPKEIKDAKKRCVHIINDGTSSEVRLAARKTEDGLICDACGHRIYTKFDKSACDRIYDCIEVINQTLLFGMLNGLEAAPIQTLISLKQILPSVARLQAELNEYVKRSDQSADSERNIAKEYNTNFRSITGMV